MTFKIFVLSILLILNIIKSVNCQTTIEYADSIRKYYNIPELGYAVVSSSKVNEMQTLGYKKINSPVKAELNDKFRIGSNTKSITGFLAAQLVKQKKINWDTKFFELFPELKAKSNKAYHNLTLLNLLSFRSRLIPYSYTYRKPVKEQFNGNEAEQRFQFIEWFFRQKPVSAKNKINPSNLAFVAAGLMLEKASGKSYKELVAELGAKLGINFGFGQPNFCDSSQPWGHNKYLIPESPGNNYKLDWLLPAGNINVSLPDYTKFIQLQLLGFLGKSDYLSKEDFNFLHYGLPEFSVGWFCKTSKTNQIYSYNIGDPGSFLSMVYIFKNSDKAIILFSNSQTEDTENGLVILLNELKRRYGI